MAFGNFTSIDDVAIKYQISCKRAAFVEPAAVPIHPYFRAELDFALREVDYREGDFGACENLIYPILKEAWKPYIASLMLRSHQPLNYDAELSGIPEYVVVRPSPLGRWIRKGGMYVLLVVEAKLEKFEAGWGQCAAAMLAAQKANGAPGQIIYGIVTNGRGWEFGKLMGNELIQESHAFGLPDLDGVFAALNYLFARCQEEALRLGKAA